MPATALPLSLGTTGEAVRDLQQRLTAIGAATDPVEHGLFDHNTERAVFRFQEQRGLHTTGVCDQSTWSALVEAGYELGDRLLYLRSPMLRGDDVSTLQTRLGVMGFDSGRVDGIFGPRTEAALQEFQRNIRLTIDGVAGPDVLDALGRLGSRSGSSTGIAIVRERDALRHTQLDLEGLRVVVGDGGGLGALAEAVAKALHDSGADSVVLHHPEPAVQASAANRFGADVFLGLTTVSEGPCQMSFYSTTGFESIGGRRLAEIITSLVPLEVAECRGMRIPILRETRMPAVMCHMGPADQVVSRGPEISSALLAAVIRWVDEPIVN